MKALVFVLAVGMTAQALAGMKPGDALPSADVKMKNVNGKEMSLADAKGKLGTLVVFSGLHCPFAKAWDGRIVKIANGCAKQGVGAVVIDANDPAVSGETLEAMQKHAKAAGYEFPYLSDATSEVARAFGARQTPEVFLFDKAGKLVYHGAVDDNSEAGNVKTQYLKDALDAMLAGKEPSVKETKVVGCGIKFHRK